MTAFVVYDVFTDTAFGGNQLAVIPDATGLPEDQLQRIAREFNFSETTFVYPAEDPANTAKVRIFTPTMEIPFGGHPIIGTVLALHAADLAPDNMVLELGLGPLQCSVDGGEATFTTTAPLERLATPPTSLCAACLGLPESAIVTRTHPPVLASLGLPLVFSELDSVASLKACQPNIASFRKGVALVGEAGLDFAQFAYVRSDNRLDARMFAPLDNIPEDPATGSACATITALLSQIAGKLLAFEIHQGVDMGRPSLIRTKALEGDPMPIKVTGSAVQSMQGTLTL